MQQCEFYVLWTVVFEIKTHAHSLLPELWGHAYVCFKIVLNTYHTENDDTLVSHKVDKVWNLKMWHFKWKHTDVCLLTTHICLMVGPCVVSTQLMGEQRLLRNHFQEWNLMNSPVLKSSYYEPCWGSAWLDNFCLVAGTQSLNEGEKARGGIAVFRRDWPK